MKDESPSHDSQQSKQISNESEDVIINDEMLEKKLKNKNIDNILNEIFQYSNDKNEIKDKFKKLIHDLSDVDREKLCSLMIYTSHWNNSGYSFILGILLDIKYI